MANENRFANWLNDWLDTHRWDAKRLAKEMGVSEGVISKLRNGVNEPDEATILALARVTGEDHWHLAHLAWNWPAVPPSDNLMKEPGVRDIGRTFVELARLEPEDAEKLDALAKTLLRQAHKKKGRNT